jgi:hypothetical protein
LLLLSLVVEVGFWDGIGRALGQANLPHTADQLGQTCAVAILYIGAQLFQWWRTRHVVRRQVNRALFGHSIGRRRKPAVPAVVPVVAPVPDAV